MCIRRRRRRRRVVEFRVLALLYLDWSMLGLKANCDYSAVESWALNITAAISGERCMKGRLNVWHVGFFFFVTTLVYWVWGICEHALGCFRLQERILGQSHDLGQIQQWVCRWLNMNTDWCLVGTSEVASPTSFCFLCRKENLASSLQPIRAFIEKLLSRKQNTNT